MKPFALALLSLALMMSTLSALAADSRGGEALLAQSTAPTAATSSVPSQTVKVSELPPVSVSKDWTDQAYWFFTFFLAIVGGLQVYLLWGNLRAIERQALQMERQTGILDKSVALAEKSAEAARQNIEMFVSRERAHLRVQVMPLEWPLQPGPAQVKYEVRLSGATEAYITSSCARAEITDSAEPVDDAHWWPAMSIPQTITPHDAVIAAHTQEIFPKGTLERSDLEAIEAGKKFIHFRGFIRYNDVFGTERLTRFQRVWEMSKVPNPDGTRSGRWSKRGVAAENSET